MGKINVVINGYGRIGRSLLRILYEKKLLGKSVDVKAINDLSGLEGAVYLTKYDTVHGRFNGEVKAKNNNLVIGDYEIPFLAEPDATKLPWKKNDVDVVLECTGAFTSAEKARLHLQAGAKKVFVSAPAKYSDNDKDCVTIVYKVNHEIYDPKQHTVISNGSCTTNCLAPVAKVLHENFEIERGFMTTVHAYTNDQMVLDVAHKKELRRSRAAAENIIPTTTGAAKAIGLVIPSLKGKMDGLALRVPVPCGSIVDLVVNVKKQTTKEEVNAVMKKAAETSLKGVLEYTEDPIVSSDVVHTEVSSIFDAQSTYVIGNMVKVLAWYDNEWGFSCRMVDVLTKVLAK
ncbi:MAG: type I glyceraldehyde-3-phosphate dehydrogenase [Candidatus Anstonellales archaeon]